MLTRNKEFLDAMVGGRKAKTLDDAIELTEGFFGEESVLTGLPAKFSVRAVKYSDFFLLPVAEFNAVVEQNDAMRRLVEAYAQRRAGAGSRQMRRTLTVAHCKKPPDSGGKAGGKLAC